MLKSLLIKNRTLKNKLKFIHDMTRWGLPNVFRRSIAITPRAQGWLDDLNRNGAVMIHCEKYEKVADLVSKKYLDVIETSITQEGLKFDPKYKLGKNEDNMSFIKFIKNYTSDHEAIAGAISFMSEEVKSLLLDEELNALFYNYYHRQPYYIGPLDIYINRSNKKIKTFVDWHVDHLHDLHIGLLLEDLTEEETHLEYVTGTHRRNMWKQGINPDDKNGGPIVQSIVEENRENIIKVFGKKGTLYMGDISGVHRKLEGIKGSRKVMFFGVNTGHHGVKNGRTRFHIMKTDWTALQSKNKFVQRMFKNLPQTKETMAPYVEEIYL